MKPYQLNHIILELEKRFEDLKYTQSEYKMNVESHNKITDALTLINETIGDLKKEYRKEKIKIKGAVET